MKTHLSGAGEYFKSIFNPGMDTLIVFVTSRCNCRCEHCFYWRELNNPVELPLSQIESLSISAGRIRSLMISGGEPFLRKDLSEIASLFISNAGVKTFSIPTNGVLSKDILAQVESMCQQFPSTLSKINVSLDAFEDVHNKMRGSKGVFKRAIETLKELVSLRSCTPNLEVNVTTVICRENLDQIEEFAAFVQTLGVDNHNIEIIRGEAKNPSLNLERQDLINRFLTTCLQANTGFAGKRGGAGEGSMMSLSGLSKFLDRANRVHQSRLKSEYLLRQKKWGVQCRAGKNICVVEPNGELRACELRSPVCNLNDFNFDLKRALASKCISDERDQIKSQRCSCTHGCFLSVSCRLSVAESLVKAPITYLKRRSSFGTR